MSSQTSEMSEVGLDDDQTSDARPVCHSELNAQDDSLDAQIRLLESTLTESNDLQDFLDSNKKEDCNKRNSSKNDPDMDIVECLTNDNCMPTSYPCDKQCEMLPQTSYEINLNLNAKNSPLSQSSSEGTCGDKRSNEENLSRSNTFFENQVNWELSVEMKDTTLSPNKSQLVDIKEDTVLLNTHTANGPDFYLTSQPSSGDGGTVQYLEVGAVKCLEKDSFAETGVCDSQNSEFVDMPTLVKEKIITELEEHEVCKSNYSSQDAKYSPSTPKGREFLEDKTHQVDELQPSRDKVVYCSTPNNFGKRCNSFCEELSVNDDFGQTTPLSKNKLSDKNESKLGRKRKQLECIEEVDENVSDSLIGKKLKCDGPSNKMNMEELSVKAENNELDSFSLIPRYETPAKSILKKWQSSNLARSASSSYLILDECGKSDEEDTNTATSQHSTKEEEIDDFEIACKSLNEELMKCSSNIENLEKFQSHDLAESQIDVEKLDDYLQELSQSFDLGEKTSLTIQDMEESEVSEKNLVDLDKTLVDDGNNTLKYDEQINNVLINLKTDENKSSARKINEQNSNFVNEQSETHKESKNHEDMVNDQNSNEQQNICNNMVMDEEDVLLSEEATEQRKPYVFFEFVSENPKENEDNYNPEWQKLGKLTSDEERYKAVRDRWRSLVPPDPNRNLTVRQWRKRNHLPPLITPYNNNYMAFEDEEKTQLCTAVYQNQIRKLQQELKEQTFIISDRMHQDFDRLGIQQDAEQRALFRRGGNGRDIANLQRRLIQECEALKFRYVKERRRVKHQIENKIDKLKKASEEVLLFQKYYRGVRATDDSACLFSDVQVQELIETEEMLESYSKFYRG